MIRIVIQGLLARKLRLVTTALAVTLGVAFMAGTLVLTDTINRTFNDLFANVYQGTDAVVRATAVFNGPQFTGGQRPLVDAGLVPALSRVSGVATAEGVVSGYARLVGKNGKAIGNPAAGAPTLGGNWSASPQLNQFRLVAGHAPRAPDEVVIDKQSAIVGHLSAGDVTTVLVQGPPLRVRISGIATFGTVNSLAGASMVLFTTPMAQRLIARPGMFTEIHFVARGGVSQQQLVSNLRRALPPGTEAVTGAAVTKEAQDIIRQFMSFFGTFMIVFAIVALLVGAFMIFNTFSITVAQRTRENGLLRALGASRRQVLIAVLIEALAVGVLASLIGLAAGVAVAIGLKAMLGALGLGVPTGGIVFAARTVIVSLLAGVTVTVVAAISPARKAAKVPPVAAMNEVASGSAGYGSKERVVVGAGILTLGVAALLTGLFGGISHTMQVVGAGAVLVFFGVSVLGRTVALPLSRVIGAPLPRLLGVTGGLARRNAMRNPKRTAASASALMIGVGLVCFITIFASSSTASVNANINRTFAGDIVIDSGAGMTGGIDPGLAARLSTLPQVAAATGKSIGLVEIAGRVEQIAAVDPATAGKIFHVKATAGSIRDLGANDIAIYEGVARSRHIKIGDSVPVLFKDTGLQLLRVALIYADNEAAPAAVAGAKASYFLGSPTYEANFADRYDAQIYVQKGPAASLAATLALVRQVAAHYPGTTVLDQSGYKKEQTKGINQLLALVYALLALAIVIALLGIGNTLALSIFERTRELGLLRAVGMTRRQLRSSVRWESVIIALQGTVLGLLIGVFFGWALVLALKDQGITVFSVPVASMVAVVVLAGLAGVLAAVLPSRRAARLNILRAITTE
jgi:putative ABC transport system permease protein